MKIAYVTTYDATNIHAWSGLGYYIPKTLVQAGFQVDYIGALKERFARLFKAKKILYRKLLAKNYLLPYSEPYVLRSYARQVEVALPEINPDVIFSPGSYHIAYLRTSKPVVFWADATIAGLIDFYPQFSNLCHRTIRNGKRMEQEALSRCRLAIYSSEWAAKTSIENYDVDPRKVKVVPFGANIDSDRNLHDVEEILMRKEVSKCKLLFIGVDWFRKGGDVALEIARMLNEKGLETELHIVGCIPPVEVPEFVTIHGFVSKRTEEGKRILNHLFADSHFLILPSRAECFGVVFAEASSFGLPSLATNVGGIPTAIRNGINGQAFPLAENPEKYCEYIMRVMSSKEEYHQFALSSFREYSERLNWSSAGKKVSELIYEFCA